MPQFKHAFLIGASPDAVWEVLENPSFVPKLYPDFISTKTVPEGRASLGQLRISTARAGSKVFEIRTEVAELVPGKKLVLVAPKGGAFDTLKESVELSPSGGGTQVRASFDYVVSQSYFGGMNIVVLESAVRANAAAFLKNLKELAELKPLH